LKPLWKKKAPIPVRLPVILTVDQLEAVIRLHHYAGRFRENGLSVVVCGCGAKIPEADLWSIEPLARHQAEMIAELQK
jgi:hypothetical protein